MKYILAFILLTMVACTNTQNSFKFKAFQFVKVQDGFYTGCSGTVTFEDANVVDVKLLSDAEGSLLIIPVEVRFTNKNKVTGDKHVTTK